jgi:quercetin dioxygenase-like cupin family protein
MNITRSSEARPYDAKGHFGMTALQLHGGAANTTEVMTCGLSHFLPGGGAKESASPVEKFYYVAAGELTVITAGEATTLAAGDSCLLASGEARSIENRGASVATVVVVLAKQPSN